MSTKFVTNGGSFDSTPMITSLAISQAYNITHKSVLNIIKNLSCSSGFREFNFVYDNKIINISNYGYSILSLYLPKNVALVELITNEFQELHEIKKDIQEINANLNLDEKDNEIIGLEKDIEDKDIIINNLNVKVLELEKPRSWFFKKIDSMKNIFYILIFPTPIVPVVIFDIYGKIISIEK